MSGVGSGATLYRTTPDVLVMVIGPGSGPSQLSAAVALMSDAAQDPSRRLVLDVGNVHRLSSDLLALLLWANGRLQAQGKQLALARPSAGSRELLHRTGLDHVLTVLDRLPQEVAA